MRAIGNSRTPLYFLVLSCVLNVVLDILFVFVLGTGVAGAAWATVIAEAVSAGLCFLYIYKTYADFFPKKEDWKLERTLTGEIDAVINNALLNLRVCTVFFFPLGILLVMRNAIQPMGYKISPVISSAIELAVKILFCIVLVPKMGYMGVVITEPVIWVVCAVFLETVYLSSRQKPYTELEKLDAGLEYDFWDDEVNGRKLRAIHMCEKLNAMPQDDEAARELVIRELFAHAGENVSIGTNFNCD